MRQRVLFLLVLVATFGACTPSPKIERILAVHALPMNERPMHGGFEKSERQKKVDQEFIENATTKRGRTRDEVSKEVSMLGGEYLRRGDVSTAMKRFNQAWLLNPRNGETYWGFAIIVDTRDRNVVEAEKFFAKAVALLPNDPVLRVDYGRLLGKVKKSDESTRQFLKALELDPKARDANAGLASNYFLQLDLERAKKHAKIAFERGEGKGFNVLPILTCLIEENVDHPDDPRALSCAKAHGPTPRE